jgi:hypothetical protein
MNRTLVRYKDPERELQVMLYLTDVPELMEVPWEFLYDRPSPTAARAPSPGRSDPAGAAAHRPISAPDAWSSPTLVRQISMRTVALGLAARGGQLDYSASVRHRPPRWRGRLCVAWATRSFRPMCAASASATTEPSSTSMRSTWTDQRHGACIASSAT